MKKATQKQKDKIREFIKGASNSYKEARICDCLDGQLCYEPDEEEYKDYDECEEMIKNYRCGFCHSKELQDKFLDELNIVEASQIITTIYVCDLDKLIKREEEFLEMFTRTTKRLIDEGHMGNAYGDIHDQPPVEDYTDDEEIIAQYKTYGKEFDDLEKYQNIKTNILKINQNILERYGK